MAETRKKRKSTTPVKRKKPAKKAAKNVGGRPRKIESPEEFDKLVDQYVTDCHENEEPITWTGMAQALGFSSRKGVDNYAKRKGFLHSVKRAKLAVENAYEKRLHNNSPTGAIFALKNMGWSDRFEQEFDVGNGLAELLKDIGNTPASNPLVRLRTENGAEDA